MNGVYDMPTLGSDIIMIHKEDMKRIMDAIEWNEALTNRLMRTGGIVQFQELKELTREVKY